MAKAVVDATMSFNKPEILAKVSENLGKTMESKAIEELEVKLADRGW